MGTKNKEHNAMASHPVPILPLLGRKYGNFSDVISPTEPVSAQFPQAGVKNLYRARAECKILPPVSSVLSVEWQLLDPITASLCGKR
jgi:hypothetical protein